ncbi:heavy-metal-associated domain-containing protein [Alienimonas californiensis]|uniref:Heavy-metal-associated domain protein n=1 Tax=Alienimonas californiensis TaxID=2527989 RepID=A0A517PB34_9PLAN|nr:heavy-metal-associated domain-containing protein [Alienimonas californiensis]QDT16579.1 Heavy-metal-associated domain protein [Alienimonas californiensis]
MRRSPQTASALRGFAMLTAAAVAAAAAPAVAGDQPSAPDATRGALDRTATVITVSEMCGGCVKRIEAKLKPVDGIAKVQCDIEKQTVTVLPESGLKLSPKWLWEAMESIGKTPKRLAGPSGVFTEKPKR